MAQTVPEIRKNIVQRDGAGIDVTAISLSVRSGTWIDAAHTQNWLAGRGSMDVPAHAILGTIAGAATNTFRYWTKPRIQTARYAYSLVLRSTTDTPGSASVAIPTGGSAVDVPVGTRHNPVTTTLYADRASLSSAEAELSLDITAPSGNAIVVESLSIEAVPRTLLIVGNDLGVDRLRFWARQPIMEPSLSSQLLDRQNDLRDACRRVGGFQFSRGTTSPWTITTASPSWATLFDDDIGILGRLLYSGDTTRTYSCRVLAKCSDGTTAGTVRVNNDSGTAAASITIAAGTTSWTWLPSTGGAAATFSVDAEDNTAADGLRGAAHDDHTFECQRTAGTGSVQIATISVYEA